MIKIDRLAEPAILTLEGTNWTNELCDERRNYFIESDEYNRGIRSVKPTNPKPKKNRYAHREIKKQLHKMFGPKCAYCESHITGNSYLHVEHFRPSSVYPSLAYNWDNLLLACTICNSSYKKDKFPLMDGSSPVKDTVNPCSLDDSDRNALINPCIDKPERYFDFSDENIICRRGNRRAVFTKDVCGLDREDLNDARKIALAPFSLAITAYIRARENSDWNMLVTIATKLLEILNNPRTPYLAMFKSKLNSMSIDTEELNERVK